MRVCCACVWARAAAPAPLGWRGLPSPSLPRLSCTTTGALRLRQRGPATPQARGTHAAAGLHGREQHLQPQPLHLLGGWWWASCARCACACACVRVCGGSWGGGLPPVLGCSTTARVVHRVLPGQQQSHTATSWCWLPRALLLLFAPLPTAHSLEEHHSTSCLWSPPSPPHRTPLPPSLPHPHTHPHRSRCRRWYHHQQHRHLMRPLAAQAPAPPAARRSCRLLTWRGWSARGAPRTRAAASGERSWGYVMLCFGVMGLR